MPKNITLMGASFSDVPAVDLPQTGGGTARFVDPSPTTATDADVASGKIYFKADGTQSTGTASGGAAITITDELDSHGGTIRHINGVVLTGDTVEADKLLYGYTAHDASGTAITGSYTPPSANYQAKSGIHPSASSQTVTPDNGYDGLSSVQINAVTLTNLIAANIKSGVTVKVGDSTDDDCVASVLGTLSGVQTATGTFTGNGARSIDVTCSFEPELVYWYGDPGSSASSGTVSCLIVKGMMAANRYRNNTTSNSANIQTPITGMNTGGSSYNFRATYANGKVTLYSFSSNARNLFTSGRTYSYTFMRWS